jgi:hypothetical protein
VHVALLTLLVFQRLPTIREMSKQVLPSMEVLTPRGLRSVPFGMATKSAHSLIIIHIN